MNPNKQRIHFPLLSGQILASSVTKVPAFSGVDLLQERQMEEGGSVQIAPSN